VPFTGDDAKPALLDEIANIEKHQATWTLIAVLTGAAGGLLVAPLAAGIVGPPAVCIYILQRDKIDTNRILNDPPRPDFRVPVRARRRRFESAHMQTPIDRATAEFAEAVLERSAHVEAAVRADERAQAALAAADAASYRQRLIEGQRATERAAELVDRVTRASDGLAEAWATNVRFLEDALDPAARRSLTAGMRGEIDAVAVLPPAAHEYVRRTGLVTRDLHPRVIVTDADAGAVVSDPHDALRVRSRAYAKATARASDTVRTSYAKATRGPADERLT
jgi:hypothetical protein